MVSTELLNQLFITQNGIKKKYLHLAELFSLFTISFLMAAAMILIIP